MLKLKVSLSFVLTLLILEIVRAQNCERARSYLESALQQPPTDLVYSTPTETTNKCRLSETCCTSQAESSLISNTALKYQDLLFNKLNATIFPCLDPPLKSTVSTFIDTSRSVTIASLKQNIGQSLDETIISDFFNYLKNGIEQMDISQLQQHFQTMYFKVFLLSFKGALENNGQQIVTSDEFERCFYNVTFNKFFGSGLSTDYSRLETRFNLYLRYVWSLKTGHDALQTLLSNSLSSDCREALLRMDHCSHCSAHSDTPTGTPACHSMCLNTLRGCLVDLDTYSEVYSEYVDVLSNSYNKIRQFNPFSAVVLISNKLNSVVITTTFSSFASIKADVDTNCNTQYSSSSGRRKRSDISTPLQQITQRRAKRQSTAVPLQAISDSVTCSRNIRDLLSSLSDTICSESNSVSAYDYTCWNGTDIDSYWWTVPESDRLEQKMNPELNIQSDTGLQYKTLMGQLKTVQDNLDDCRSSPRNCDVMLNGFTEPDGDSYAFGDNAMFQSFTELGFPTPVIVSSIPVAPSMSSSIVTTTDTLVTMMTTLVTTTTTSVATVTSSSNTSLLTSISSSKVTPTITSLSTIVQSTTGILPRPSTTTATPTRPTRSTLTSGSATAQQQSTPLVNDRDNGKPDADKVKGSSNIVYSSVVLLMVSLLFATFIS